MNLKSVTKGNILLKKKLHKDELSEVVTRQSNRKCCFNSVPDRFNGQTVNFILKPPKVFESRT